MAHKFTGKDKILYLIFKGLKVGFYYRSLGIKCRWWGEREVYYASFFMQWTKKGAILFCGLYVVGLNQYIKNRRVCALALVYDSSIFSSFPEFLRSTVQGGKQNSLSYTRVTLLSDTQDTRGHLLLNVFKEAEAANKMTAPTAATQDSSW